MSADVALRFLYIATYLIVFIIAIRILMDNRPPEVLLAWTLILLLVPGLGIILYLYAGIDWKKRRIMKQLPEEILGERESELLKQQENLMEPAPDEALSDALKSMRLLIKTTRSPVTMNNRTSFFFSGETFFNQLLDDLKQARESICMEFYIWRSDRFGRHLMDLLCQKSDEGVEVSLLFDGIGSFGTISHRARRRLKRAGVRFRYFQDPTVRLNNLVINYRNHRKLALIDDSIAYTGGFNIGSEYIDGGGRFDTWRDSCVRIEGESVRLMKEIFQSDWNHSDGEPLKECETGDSQGQPLFTQVVCSGPDSSWHAIEKLYINLISNANREVWIQSPYFIPDRSMQNVLETAALSGIQVHLMITGKADKRLPYWVAETYFEPLLKAGVRIYRYHAGFLHSKMFIVDEAISSIGSCNFDLRSFRLAYETNLVFYDRDVASELTSQFQKDLKLCDEIQLDQVQRFGLFRRFRNSLSRIFSPIL